MIRLGWCVFSFLLLLTFNNLADAARSGAFKPIEHKLNDFVVGYEKGDQPGSNEACVFGYHVTEREDGSVDFNTIWIFTDLKYHFECREGMLWMVPNNDFSKATPVAVLSEKLYDEPKGWKYRKLEFDEKLVAFEMFSVPWNSMKNRYRLHLRNDCGPKLSEKFSDDHLAWRPELW